MQAPTRLGKYEIRREIGRGAMGVVYEAFDPSIGRAVAIKAFHPGASLAASADEMDARFRREAQVAGRLSHPNLVVVHEFGEADVGDAVVPYIVMELVRGADLKALLASRGRFSLAEIARIMAELLAALQHAHEHGIVHRDIKPGNVMLCDDGRVKVTDFGIAKTGDSELTRTGELLGTAAYMSPEQVTGAPVDFRTDLYSAGVILYQLLTGEQPFAGASTTSVIQKILNQEPVPPSVLNVTIPRALDAVVRQAMAKNPAARFASANAFATAIAAAIAASGNDGTTIVAPPLAVAKPRPRTRVAAITAGTAAVVAALVVAAFAWLGTNDAARSDEASRASRIATAASMAIGGSDRTPRDAAVPAPQRAASDRVVALAAPQGSAVAQTAPAASAMTAAAAHAGAALTAPALVAPAASAAIATPTPVPRPKATPPASPRPGSAASAGSPAPMKAPVTATAPTWSSLPRPVEVQPLPPTAASPATAMPRANAAAPAAVAAASASASRPTALAFAPASASPPGAKVASSASAAAAANQVLASCEAKARAGDAACQTRLGTMYRSGEGVPRNNEEALRWYRLAAAQGHAEAQNRLGFMYETGQGVAADHNEAARWYRKAADQGDAAAQNNMGRAHERGEGVTKSPVLAAQWYRKAADQGHAFAQYNLARLYQGGIGVFKDTEKARTLFQSAAGQGNVPAAYSLGLMYENGSGVPQSNSQAAYWYRLAAARPDPNLSPSSQQRIKSFLAAHP